MPGEVLCMKKNRLFDLCAAQAARIRRGFARFSAFSRGSTQPRKKNAPCWKKLFTAQNQPVKSS